MKSAPAITPWCASSLNPSIRCAQSHNWPLGHSGYGPPSGLLAMFRGVWQWASVVSSIFKTGTPFPRVRAAPDSENFMTRRSVQGSQLHAISSGAALLRARRHGLFRPNSLATRLPKACKGETSASTLPTEPNREWQLAHTPQSSRTLENNCVMIIYFT